MAIHAVPDATAMIVGIRPNRFDAFSPMMLPVIPEKNVAVAPMLSMKTMPTIFARSSWVFGFLISNGRLIGLPFSILNMLM